jgi:hypothetical protein
MLSPLTLWTRFHTHTNRRFIFKGQEESYIDPSNPFLWWSLIKLTKRPLKFQWETCGFNITHHGVLYFTVITLSVIMAHEDALQNHISLNMRATNLKSSGKTRLYKYTKLTITTCKAVLLSRGTLWNFSAQKDIAISIHYSSYHRLLLPPSVPIRRHRVASAGRPMQGFYAISETSVAGSHIYSFY